MNGVLEREVATNKLKGVQLMCPFFIIKLTTLR